MRRWLPLKTTALFHIVAALKSNKPESYKMVEINLSSFFLFFHYCAGSGLPPPRDGLQH